MYQITKSKIIKFSSFSCFLFVCFFSSVSSLTAQTTSLKFETTIKRGLISAPQKGRLFIFLNRKGENEPRLTFDSDVALDAPPMLAKDVESFKAGETKAIIDNSAISYPIKNLAELPAGEYFVQALFDTNNDVRSLNAPGNLYSEVQKVDLDAKNGVTIKLELSKIVPPETFAAGYGIHQIYQNSIRAFDEILRQTDFRSRRNRFAA